MFLFFFFFSFFIFVSQCIPRCLHLKPTDQNLWAQCIYCSSTCGCLVSGVNVICHQLPLFFLYPQQLFTKVINWSSNETIVKSEQLNFGAGSFVNVLPVCVCYICLIFLCNKSFYSLSRYIQRHKKIPDFIYQDSVLFIYTWLSHERHKFFFSTQEIIIVKAVSQWMCAYKSSL